MQFGTQQVKPSQTLLPPSCHQIATFFILYVLVPVFVLVFVIVIVFVLSLVFSVWGLIR